MASRLVERSTTLLGVQVYYFSIYDNFYTNKNCLIKYLIISYDYYDDNKIELTCK